MFRWPMIWAYIRYELRDMLEEVQADENAKADGSYYEERNDGDARDCGSGLSVDRSWT